jgi:hypothetical protein
MRLMMMRSYHRAQPSRLLPIQPLLWWSSLGAVACVSFQPRLQSLCLCAVVGSSSSSVLAKERKKEDKVL